MKRTFLYSICLLFFACNNAKEMDIWEPIEGRWVRTNDQTGKQTFEFWEKDAETWKGLGFTLQEDDTVFKEVLSIEKIEDDIVYRVRGVHEEDVLFYLRPSDKGLVFQNDSNAFPKVIEYYSSLDKLAVWIHDRNDSVLFEFKRLPQ